MLSGRLQDRADEQVINAFKKQACLKQQQVRAIVVFFCCCVVVVLFCCCCAVVVLGRCCVTWQHCNTVVGLLKHCCCNP